MAEAKKPAAKKPAAKKPAAKKPVAEKKPAPAPKKVAEKKPAPVAKPVETKAVTETPKVVAPKKEPKDVGEGKLLYTIRLEPEYIAKLEAEGAKRGVKHAVIAREAIHAFFDTIRTKKAA